jgi:serine/threonine protein kinase
MLEFNRILAQKKKLSYVPKAKHFILMRKLGEGTYSKVYQACHKKTGLICALKILDKKRVIETDMIENVID